jgi:hypothetical protein
MPTHTFDIDPIALMLTVRDPALFRSAEIVLDCTGIGLIARRGERMLIRCANLEDLTLLGQMLAARAE